MLTRKLGVIGKVVCYRRKDLFLSSGPSGAMNFVLSLRQELLLVGQVLPWELFQVQLSRNSCHE